MTKSAGINFTPYIGDNQANVSDLRVKIQSMPSKGSITTTYRNRILDSAITIDSEYQASDLLYTANDSECTNHYTDAFTYNVVDPDTLESSISTVTINGSPFNCNPVASDFSRTLDQEYTPDIVSFYLDFEINISDYEDPDSSLKVEFTTLPAFGNLETGYASDSTSSIGNWVILSSFYGSGTVSFVPASDLCKPFTDAFYYRVKDANDGLSSERKVTISAPTWKGGSSCKSVNIVLIVVPIVGAVVLTP